MTPVNAPNLGCAQHADGSLRDASEIEWTFDKDESILFPSVNEHEGSSLIHPFFTGAIPPAMMVGGARRSTQTHHPLQCAQDTAQSFSSDIQARIMSSVKHKADTTAPHWYVAHKTIASSDDEGKSDSSGSITEVAEDKERDCLGVHIKKAMADADNIGQLVAPSPYSWVT